MPTDAQQQAASLNQDERLREVRIQKLQAEAAKLEAERELINMRRRWRPVVWITIVLVMIGATLGLSGG